MSLFGNIVDKIVSYAETTVGGSPAKAAAAAPASSDGTPPSTSSDGTPPSTSSDGTPPAAAPAATPPTQAAGAATPLGSVDIGAVLTSRAAEQGGSLHWQTSIVDLLKVLDLDSSLDARKQLANELDVHAGADGSAEENVALHKAVVAKLEANGGQVPADMKA